MATIWISAILLALVKNAVSDYDPSLCSIKETSYGEIPPPLPRNFEMKGERVDHKHKSASYEEFYFDYTNQRAKYKYLLDTLEYNYLFDYDTQQIVEWIKVHPGVSMKRDPLSHTCNAVPMEDSKYSYLFGYQDWLSDTSKMYNSFEALRYGGQYLYAANGTEKLDERNLKVNVFQGCLYDKELRATMFNDYYFADTNSLEPSAGTSSKVVTGATDKPLSVPVKLHITGRISDDSAPLSFNETVSISWFKGEPNFREETFQIPPWVYCKDYRGRKERPKFPTAFSTRLIVTQFRVDMLGQLVTDASKESYEEVYYDLDRLLARRDFSPKRGVDTEIFSKFGNYLPVRTIYDFNEGLKFTINKVSGRCYIVPIPDNDYFDTEEKLNFRKMGTPEEVFLMQMDDMEYKGKAFARDIECGVWSGKHFHEAYNATVVKEAYFATRAWHENVDGAVERNIPVKNVLIQKELNGEALEGIRSFDFIKFKHRQPPISSFDLKNCVEYIDHKRFAIQLALSDDNAAAELVFKFKYAFLEAAQLVITNKTGVVTPLRVQRLHVRHLSVRSGRAVFLIFSLLGKADLGSYTYGQSGKTLDEAIVLLQRVVDAGQFYVEFNNTKTKEPIAVTAERGGIYILTADGNLTPAPLQPAKPRNPKSAGYYHTVDITDTEVYVHRGMTAGHLALLAFAMLFIGVGVGIAIMYLYLRVYSERHVEDRMNLSEKGEQPSIDTPPATGDIEETPQET